AKRANIVKLSVKAARILVKSELHRAGAATQAGAGEVTGQSSTHHLRIGLRGTAIKLRPAHGSDNSIRLASEVVACRCGAAIQTWEGCSEPVRQRRRPAGSV